MVNYTLSIEIDGKKLVKTTSNKAEFLRFVMLYVKGNYQEKIQVYNDIINKTEKQLLKIKTNKNEHL